MIKKNIKHQLNYLCNVNNCFIYESHVYELIRDKKSKYMKKSVYKYRQIFDYDDYDYVTDKKLKQELDRHIKQLEKYLK